LSSNTNIPEATAAGYPDNFKGVFVQEAVIGLPSKWFNSVENTTQKKMNIFPIRNKQEYCKKKSVFLLILFFITYSKTNHLKIYCFC
jgi:hypothetical protein